MIVEIQTTNGLGLSDYDLIKDRIYKKEYCFTRHNGSIYKEDRFYIKIKDLEDLVDLCSMDLLILSKSDGNDKMVQLDIEIYNDYRE